jgi:NitT/TauT family transport system permease protein
MRLFVHKERFIVPVIVLLAWEAFSRSGVIPPALLPAPSKVIWTWGGLDIRY